jgi:exodeoxyribonuclease VII small subunit
VTMSGADAPRAAAAHGPAATPGPLPAAIETLTFDEALSELQRTVAALEEGGLPLERTLELYERGAALHARCAILLDEAELRIRRLAEGPDGTPTLVDEPGEDAGRPAPQGPAAEEAAR